MFLNSSRYLCLLNFTFKKHHSQLPGRQQKDTQPHRENLTEIYLVLSFFILNQISGTFFFLFLTLKYHLISFTKKTDLSYPHSPCHTAYKLPGHLCSSSSVPESLLTASEGLGKILTTKTTRSYSF